MAIALANEEGLDAACAANAGLIATEMATNLLKHAREGEIQIARLSPQGFPGLDLLSIDRGPGILDLQKCFADGFSTAGTPGTGLGAVARNSGVFDAYSEHGKGTVIMSRIVGRGKRADNLEDGLIIGSAGRPVSGEEVSGDSWAVRESPQASFFIVADGLGHGVHAAQASQEAISAFRTSFETTPAAILQRVHRALRGTRGAAVAIAKVDRKERRIYYAGIGNISGLILGSAKAQQMISHNGTAGHEALRFQEFVYPFPESAILIMHSDGLTTSWNLDAYPGIRRHHPAIIAATLYRDATRKRDDVCVVAAKEDVHER